ncbi:hypothetical protein [Hymenobacter sp. GOD-10R]|uniref:hypothetical protein n=1 Tax=Hymenobacter sp. GOD-10R TaxID=3093922 RepID=UPI002D79A84B|nr:hypothetical protein [Hymenobacter sp. GOD-10R]WRQ30043.1 hypothetical protein SD425_07190 [Hymenobacter sp. GOD-10R]
MIIHGRSSSHSAQESPATTLCHACRTGADQVQVLGQRAWVDWSAWLPAAHEETTCFYCRRTLEHPRPVLHLLTTGLAFLQRATTASWHHVGLLLLALVILNTFTASGLAHKESLAYLNRPHTGDLYHVRTQEGNYSLLKVVAVDGNSVQLQANTYQTSSSSEIADLNKPENYDRESFDLTRYDLQIMKQKEQILDVERPD